jgi:glutathione S-transferase
MLTLYYAPGSCARAPLIALAEANADYGIEKLDMAQNAQRQAAYLAVNPKGRVPALVTPHGVLTENVAILAYIAQTHPAARLAPLDDPFAFAQMQAFHSYLSSTVHVAHAHGRRAYRWSDDAAAQATMQQKVAQNMLESFQLIESSMLKGPWVMGDAYTVADAYLYTLSGWLEGDGVPLSKLPAIQDHHQRVGARPAVQRALAQEAAGTVQL